MTNENAKAISSATRRQTFGHNNVDWPVNVLAITPEEDPVMVRSRKLDQASGWKSRPGKHRSAG